MAAGLLEMQGEDCKGLAAGRAPLLHLEGLLLAPMEKGHEHPGERPGGTGKLQRAGAAAQARKCSMMFSLRSQRKKPNSPPSLQLKVLLQSRRGNACFSPDHMRTHERLQSVKAEFQQH